MIHINIIVITYFKLKKDVNTFFKFLNIDYWIHFFGLPLVRYLFVLTANVAPFPLHSCRVRQHHVRHCVSWRVVPYDQWQNGTEEETDRRIVLRHRLPRLFIYILQYRFFRHISDRIHNHYSGHNNPSLLLYINREKKICIAVLRFVLQILLTDCMDYNNI